MILLIFSFFLISSSSAEKILKIGLEFQSIAKRLPEIVSRMKLLRSLHEEGALFSQRLKYLESTKKESVATLEHDRDTLRTLQTTWMENMNTIQNNIESLHERFAVLQANQE